MTDNSGTPVPPSDQNPQPAAPPYNAQPAPSPYGAPGAPGGEDPGKTLGIVGLVLAFVFALAGLVVSIVANNKSKQAGFTNTPAKVGIILSIVFLVLGIILAILFVVLLGAGLAGFAEACEGLRSGTYDAGDGGTIVCP